MIYTAVQWHLTDAAVHFRMSAEAGLPDNTTSKTIDTKVY